MRCPSCRKLTPARPFLRRKAAVNYALKEVVSQWFNSPLSTGTVRRVVLCSRPIQTENLLFSNNETDHPAPENTATVEHIADEETREVLFHVCDKFMHDQAEEKDAHELFVILDDAIDENQMTSSSEEESDHEVIPLLGDLNVINMEDRVAAPPFLLSRLQLALRNTMAFVAGEFAMVIRGIRDSRSRLILTVFWFVYGGIVVCIASGFLPWMMFYTLIYFIILYAELSPQAIMGG